MPEIISGTIKEKKVVERLLYTDPATNEKIVHESDIPFYKYQERIVFGSNSKIDPKSIDDYLAIGGYSALAKALSHMSAEEVLQEVKKANLRGRGGGGFPAGSKWEGSRNAPEPIKYVIVNADEGDPGAYMDRSVLEGQSPLGPRGADDRGLCRRRPRGLYLRAAGIPPCGRECAHRHREGRGVRLSRARTSSARASISRSSCIRGAGAFVCGESTALMTALEGRAGEPRPKYVRSNVVGLWGKPSVLNNVETWANVPLIINKGADWFTRLGTEKQQGHEDILPRREDHQYGPRGSTHGHALTGYHLQDRRRHPRG